MGSTVQRVTKFSVRQNPPVQYSLENMAQRRASLIGFVLAAALLECGCTGCQSSTAQGDHFHPGENAKLKLAILSPPQILLCPSAGVPIMQASQSGTGHHKVILSWNPSSPSANPDANPAGYCLYRSHTQNAARQNPVCSACEPINLVPVAASACLDDLVQDSTTYYYVVTAISATRKQSASSNEIAVRIPAANQPGATPVLNPPPVCRVAVPSP
jgi:hypothetical protein